MSNRRNTYWVALAVTVAAVAIVVGLLRSRIGPGLTAVRDDQTAARSSGVRTERSKRLVFLLGAAGCGAAEALLARSLRVQPDSAFGVVFSASMIFCLIIGGVGTIEGPILGAIIFFVLQNRFANFGPV